MKNRYKLMGFALFGMGIVSFLLMRLQQKCINHWKGLAEKNKALFTWMDQWIYLKQEDKNLEAYFIRNNYKRIAIYGVGNVGLCLIRELKHSEIEIVYGIDRNARNIHSDIKLVTMDDHLFNVDAIVVTVAGGFDIIFDELSQKVECPIIAIEDILNET